MEETLEEKLKQFKHTKAVGEGYPRGYKAHINAFMEGFNSGRFDEYLKPSFVESRKVANETLAEYNKLIKMNWKIAKAKMVVEILDMKSEIEKARLLYGVTSKSYDILQAKIAVLEFACMSLPNIEEGDKF